MAAAAAVTSQRPDHLAAVGTCPGADDAPAGLRRQQPKAPAAGAARLRPFLLAPPAPGDLLAAKRCAAAGAASKRRHGQTGGIDRPRAGFGSGRDWRAGIDAG